ncbi:MAG: response regulator, partial [Thermodesulfovibrionia bacterium]
GTTFRIYLPLVRKEVKEEETADEPAAVGGTETILLAEDEPLVRTALRIVMEERGFKVIEAVNGDDAIEKFMENRDKIDFIVLDVVMPGKSGKDAYDAIKMVKPDIKAIFTSGYISSRLSVKEIFEEGLTFISKPVQPNDLIKKIREMLDN